MPITLRNVQPDAAAKLRQLEVGAAALDRAVRDMIPEELRQQIGPRLPRRAVVKARAYFGPAYAALRSTLAALARAMPYVAAALRTLRALVADALLCISAAGAVLLALALAILIVAPPA